MTVHDSVAIVARMKYSISEVSELTEASPRTIRYWISQGVLMRPKGVGRNSYYTDDHLERIGIVQEMAEEGMTLNEIRIRFQLDTAQPERVEEGEEVAQRPSDASWRHLPCHPELLILIRYDLPEKRAQEIEEAVAEMNERITRTEDETK